MEAVGEEVSLQREVIKADNNHLADHVVRCFVSELKNKRLDFPPTSPEPLHHIFQVTTVAKNIVLNSNLDEGEKKNLTDEAIRYGYTHDIGRSKSAGVKIYHADDHPRDGRVMLQELKFPEKYADFALDHHRMGFGLEIPGRPNNLQLAKEKGVEALTEFYDKKYGLAGLASFVADLSKAYNDPANKNMPTIAEFTEESAEKLIKRQIENGNFKEGDEKHQTELLGVKFILHTIKYLKDKYGVDYNKAVKDAQADWERNEKPRLEGRWLKNTTKTIATASPQSTH